ncbi:hypothetical protein A1O3_04319 [Capronia epimyces CBS 606.96]|uniref:RRM domain-containing protein n=1 Tax=Capronia epimyces CBS 606.96 TaxID=1182542 RepID=W9YCJ4_9EURO|nr:uncharacterized protein A1O3_04319 [Capronia epimyces CBS 606.96]EXJ87360.1 hypothetical protein A1O3_04319 [Capronia epimyces CBS 606.96]
MAASFDDPRSVIAFLRAMHSTPTSKTSDMQVSPVTDGSNLDLAVPAPQKDVESGSGEDARPASESPRCASPTNVLTPKSPNMPLKTTSSAKTQLTPTQQKLLRKKDAAEVKAQQSYLSMQKETKGYMDSVIEQHRQSNVSMFASSPVKHPASVAEPGGRTIGMPEGMPEVAARQYANEITNIDSLEHISFAENRHPAKMPTPASGGAIANAGTVDVTGFTTADMPRTPSQSDNSNIAVSHSPSIAIKAGHPAAENDSCINGEEDKDEEIREDTEDREHLTHFKSWGTPAKRNRPASRVRTVILAGLPRAADFTFVQSLVRGGSIETMKLSTGKTGSVKATAFVTFTTGDACDKYMEKYPNSIEVRYEGKKYMVLVHKSTNIDVMSGMMQGYLDCGASRVVKATGADDDWGIVALSKLAEGKNKARQVEAVTDSLHNGVRTILFRFANISDAVKFKGTLIRDYDWEGCRIEFADDPCAKATGIHYD